MQSMSCMGPTSPIASAGFSPKSRRLRSLRTSVASDRGRSASAQHNSQFTAPVPGGHGASATHLHIQDPVARYTGMQDHCISHKPVNCPGDRLARASAKHASHTVATQTGGQEHLQSARAKLLPRQACKITRTSHTLSCCKRYRQATVSVCARVWCQYRDPAGSFAAAGW